MTVAQFPIKGFPDLDELLQRAPSARLASSRLDLVNLAAGGEASKEFEVAYDVPGKGRVVEAHVVRCRNGVAVNYVEPYMRRRDPDCMVIADEGATDKPRFSDRFPGRFEDLRSEVFRWLATQDLLLVPFIAGHDRLGYDALLVSPVNAAFFAAGLADLQGMLTPDQIPEEFSPRAVIYLAPPFRHTHCQGRQLVIHNRSGEVHELFSLNLYPGPSAKKGIYGVLLSVGEQEGWVTCHGSTVQVVTPYDNVITIMHEGASGGGKSEMLEYPHRETDGRLLLGENTVTGDRRYVVLNQACELRPVTDDMAQSHPAIQRDHSKLVVTDAEKGWFLRVNHIDRYGVDPNYERLCLQPPEPLVFLNFHAVADSTCILWEHIEDAPGKRCPNPRVILPRRLVPNIVNDPVGIDVRSFGIRTPPATKDVPSYGIFGLLQVLPPSLAWLWRLVAPRGHANPSIIDTEGMSSEGVGSYWPFATGRIVDQVNLLLHQIRDTPATGYTITPNQHVGAWRVGFMPQWLAREYLARRGGVRFTREQLVPARCPLLGYCLKSMRLEGTTIPRWFLEVHTQPELTESGYDAGAKLLMDFFRKELAPLLEESDLDPLGREIIECCLQGGALSDYERLLGSPVRAATDAFSFPSRRVRAITPVDPDEEIPSL
ncbi:MAG: DUF4914 family protein [Candidatus Sumerlaeia bacterium]|nr:DUF4914 family protein [Candidatus Sumerlaeia bacterium]